LSFKIFVNEEAVEVEKSTSVEEVLVQVGIKDFSGVAVALENAVVPREEWNKTSFMPEQSLIVFTAAQGG